MLIQTFTNVYLHSTTEPFKRDLHPILVAQLVVVVQTSPVDPHDARGTKPSLQLTACCLKREVHQDGLLASDTLHVYLDGAPWYLTPRDTMYDDI